MSGDTNLLNKALISGVKAQKPEDLVQWLLGQKNAKKSQSNIQVLSAKVSKLFSYILSTEFKDYFGEAVYYSKSFKPLPWNMKSCLEYMQRYYFEIIDQTVQKQCKKAISEFYQLINLNDGLLKKSF